MAIACKPATPAPSTNTLAGVIVPAAVIIMGNIFGSVARGQNYCPITGERRHGRKRVHALRASDPRHEFHREKADVSRGEFGTGLEAT